MRYAVRFTDSFGYTFLGGAYYTDKAAACDACRGYRLKMNRTGLVMPVGPGGAAVVTNMVVVAV